VPTDELDIYNPKSWKKDALLQPQTRELWRRLLGQGWVDALRHQFPDEKIFTFWDYFRQHWERNGGLRIDHLLLNRALAPRLRGAGVDRWVRGAAHASDHAPTWIELADATSAQAAPKKAATKKARSAATRGRRAPARRSRAAGRGGRRS
jgi:exodeoxyribonuclease III